MPRFLCTKTGQFIWIAKPREVCYAILSHTWRPREEGGEQSYQEVLKIQAAAAEELRGTTKGPQTAPSDPYPGQDAIPTPLPSILSRPELSQKIRSFCAVARNAGYDLAWADSCCIDQSSSAELSEAINSMYEWYRAADVCYAYLADVSDDDKPTLPGSQFRGSRWHTRGWTLQELVAPRRVVFLSCSWRVIGTKFGLAVVLQEITGVHLPILLNNDTVRRASVAQRMSWAADRETTRVEDIAYCLLGLFGVYMAPIYGEGRNAFLRLQEEIVKTVQDHTIFAWGTHVNLSVEADSSDILVAPDEDSVGRVQSGVALLASSPRAFKNASNIVEAVISDVADLAGAPMESFLWTTQCVFTPNGITLTLPCVSVSRWPTRTLARATLDIFPSHKYSHLAFLQCRVQDGPFICLPILSPAGVYSSCTVHYPLAYVRRTYKSTEWLTDSRFRTIRLTPDVIKVVQARQDLSSTVSNRSFLVHTHDGTSNTESFDMPWLGNLRAGMPSLSTSRRGDQGVVNEDRDIYILAPGCKEELQAFGFDIAVAASPYECHPASDVQAVAGYGHRFLATLSSAAAPFGEGHLEAVSTQYRLQIDFFCNNSGQIVWYLGYGVQHILEEPPRASSGPILDPSEDYFVDGGKGRPPRICEANVEVVWVSPPPSPLTTGRNRIVAGKLRAVIKDPACAASPFFARFIQVTAEFAPAEDLRARLEAGRPGGRYLVYVELSEPVARHGLSPTSYHQIGCTPWREALSMVIPDGDSTPTRRMSPEGDDEDRALEPVVRY
ncbi:hypothetical protein PYCCODRAFT_1479994 [Trametes coccinea BRFM310]|uniref:Uncharacterized protein n=1 Tax=Trametes coccinea (strain BRFM310) TaxID=1353009 RepID=A0A1Y2IE02_TRAC3|nr:hypothetical protein PYCCODRAFT_1479994 [Trametes coccinea BRFM310]